MCQADAWHGTHSSAVGGATKPSSQAWIRLWIRDLRYSLRVISKRAPELTRADISRTALVGTKRELELSQTMAPEMTLNDSLAADSVLDGLADGVYAVNSDFRIIPLQPGGRKDSRRREGPGTGSALPGRLLSLGTVFFGRVLRRRPF